MTETNPLIDKAIEVAGGPTALAKAVGVKTPTVTQWQKKVRPVPPGRCRAIEEAVSGQVTRYQLRPDIFGDGPPVPENLTFTQPALKQAQ